ncbi:hypothetical protein [Planctomycetes bacterium TBK1r]|uniref:hypothetical protein n=1 Tax=Stieleria magnilauensis TaxID=2527963 RepID=UPI00119F1F3F
MRFFVTNVTVWIADAPYPHISRCRQALASAPFHFVVRGETPRTSAVSPDRQPREITKLDEPFEVRGFHREFLQRFVDSQKSLQSVALGVDQWRITVRHGCLANAIR